MPTITNLALKTFAAVAAAVVALAHVPAADAQELAHHGHHRGFAPGVSHVVVPQARSWVLSSQLPGLTHGGTHQPSHHAELGIESVHARVEILEQVATTHLEVRLVNPGGRDAEAVVLLPVPVGAAVTGFDFDGAAAEPTAELIPAAEARATYDDIVRRLKDPALLEFAGYDMLRSSVFPVPAGGNQRLRLTYTQVCDVDGARTDFVLPRSESLFGGGRIPWTIEVTLRGSRPVGALYSPSHELDEPLRSASASGPISVRTSSAASTQPGAFRLSWLRDSGTPEASLFAYPDADGDGGYFLLMAGVPARIADAAEVPKREVTLVIDCSGSMRGGKLDQAVSAALQVIEGLEDGETFNLIDYSNQVGVFSAAPVVKSAATMAEAREYLGRLRPTGGTNIHDALVEALHQPTTEGSLGVVLFLTDGLPTVGTRSELAIATAARKANAAGRRIFTFGVGEDVNAPLLDRLSEDARGLTTYIDPGADVELAVDGVFRKLQGPVLALPELRLVNGDGTTNTRRLRELCPPVLPDLYEGGSAILLGRYHGDEPLDLRLTGDFLGSPREFAFRFDLDHATTRNAFVPRLWASRRIAYLTEEVRQAGAELTAAQLAGRVDLMAEGRYAELGEEILRLSTTYGVLSEYTAFLALEGSDLGNWDALVADANRNLNDRAVLSRSGAGGVNQGKNYQALKAQACLNVTNGQWSSANQRVEFSGVQQIADVAFYQRGGAWIDSSLVGSTDLEPDEVIELGSARHKQLVGELALLGRAGAGALNGRVLMNHGGQKLLVCNDVMAPEVAVPNNSLPADSPADTNITNELETLEVSL